MSTITAIKQQKKKDRVNVYLDDKFSAQGGPASGWGFGIDLDNFVKLGLRVGQELSEEEVVEIVRKAEFQKTLDKLLRFAMVRPRSEKEIKDYFKRKEVHESLHPDLLKKLIHLNLLNDLEFARWWIDQRQNFRPKPKRILNQELRIKGIKPEIIEEVLGPEEIDEEKMARELLEKKMYKWEKLEPRLKRQKMSQYLAGKGFGWDVIQKVVDRNIDSV